MMSLFMVSYSLWSLYCFFQSGLWPYRNFDLSIFMNFQNFESKIVSAFDKSYKSVINKVGVVPSVVIFVPFCLLLSLIGTMTVKKIQTLPIFSHTLNNNIRLTVSASNKKSSWGKIFKNFRKMFPFLGYSPIKRVVPIPQTSY